MSESIYLWVGTSNPYNSLYLQASLLAEVLEVQFAVKTMLWHPGIVDVRKKLKALRKSSATFICFFGGFDHWIIPFMRRPKTIFVYHNITPAHFLWLWQPLVAVKSLMGQLQLLSIPRNSQWIAVSNYNREELNKFGFRNISVCPNIVDVGSSISFPKIEPIKLLYTGRIAPNKNCLELLNHAAIAANHLARPIEITLVGDTKRKCRYGLTFQNKLYKMSNHGWLTAKWEPAGLTQASLETLYRQAWLYVSMSLHEGFGLPVCEAVMQGTPALYMECGGTESIFDKLGMVPLGERSRYWFHICEYINSETRRRQLLLAQLDLVKGYTMPNVGRTICQVYGPLLHLL
jgi:glycosyltransferase involved in cell wall biosynthesis